MNRINIVLCTAFLAFGACAQAPDSDNGLNTGLSMTEPTTPKPDAGGSTDTMPPQQGTDTKPPATDTTPSCPPAGCQPTPPPADKCDDKIPCTVDTCSAEGVCNNEPDHSLCPGDDTYCKPNDPNRDSNGCVHVPPAPEPECKAHVDCDDKKTCTQDLCTDGVCKHERMDNLCGNGCTCAPDAPGADPTSGCHTPPVTPTCGDGICNGSETTETCPADCKPAQPEKPTMTCRVEYNRLKITFSGPVQNGFVMSSPPVSYLQYGSDADVNGNGTWPAQYGYKPYAQGVKPMFAWNGTTTVVDLPAAVNSFTMYGTDASLNTIYWVQNDKWIIQGACHFCDAAAKDKICH